MIVVDADDESVAARNLDRDLAGREGRLFLEVKVAVLVLLGWRRGRRLWRGGLRLNGWLGRLLARCEASSQ